MSAPLPNNLLTAALEYAERGWPVFPCGVDKKPLTPHGFKDASKAPEMIKAWWGRTPGASIGCPTGPQMGAWVLDVDLPEGPATLAELEATHGLLPTTVEQQTGSGGRHLFFTCPEGREVRNTSGERGKLGPGLDVRGAGGYVILPPSGHPLGGFYSWSGNGAPLADAPEWLLDMVAPMPKPEAPKPATPTPAKSAGTTPYGRKALEDEAAKVAETNQGGRNDALNTAAFSLGQLVGGGELSVAEAKTALQAAADAAGLPADEARKTIESGMAAGQAKPRNAREKHTGQSGGRAIGAEPEAKPGFLASINLSDFLAANFVDTEPEPLEWTFGASMVAGTMGYLVGPAGAGKSGLEMVLAASIATGRSLFGDHLKPGVTGKVLVLAAEEDIRLVHVRLKRLYERLFPIRFSADGHFNLDFERDPSSELFKENIIVVPCAGKDLRLVETHPGGDVTASQNFKELLTLAKSIDGLALTFVDPLSRFYGADENNNTVATFFSTLLETIAQETGASTICVHHVGKRAGFISGKFSVNEAMSPDVIRGASGLTGAARWQMNLFPVPPTDVEKLLGVKDAKPGEYLVCGVVKNNYAKLTDHFFLKRERNFLAPFEPSSVPRVSVDVLDAVTKKIIAIVKDREQKNEPPLTIKLLKDTMPARWKGELPGVTKSVVEAAANMALVDNKLFLTSRMNPGNRKLTDYLATTPDSTPDGGGTGQPDGTGQEAPSGVKVAQDLDSGTGQDGTGQENLSGPGTRANPSPDTGQLFPLRGEEGPSGAGLLPSGSPLDGQLVHQVVGDEVVL